MTYKEILELACTLIELKVKVWRGPDKVMAVPATIFGRGSTGLNSASSDGELRPFAASLPTTMPTYDYSCEKCGKTFEVFQSMRDEPFRECLKELCRQKKWGHGKVKRLVGTGAG
ncbi:MAG: zinc ribbon domain-containing protein, partial [Verrucomicrobiota bacterium]